MEPLKRQQRKVDNEYTIMFIPHRGKEPKSFSFHASLLKKSAFSAASCFWQALALQQNLPWLFTRHTRNKTNL